MSERKDGSMKIFEYDKNKKNRDNFLVKNGISGENVFAAEIVHGSNVAIIGKKSPRFIKNADALVTKEEVFLMVTIADCVPVYFYDEKNKVIGLAHAGWRGIISGIIGNTLDKMLSLGARVEETSIVMGPGIRECRFEVREDVVAKFKNYSEFIIQKEEKIFINLFGVAKKQLLDFGIKEENILDYGECTFENKEKFFSYRRDKPEVVEAMIAVIGMI